MSADDVVVILHTFGDEFRVVHTTDSFLDNQYYDNDAKNYWSEIYNSPAEEEALKAVGYCPSKLPEEFQCHDTEGEISLGFVKLLWGKCQVFTNKTDAMKYAEKLADPANNGGFYPEYGIRIQELPFHFPA